VKLLLHIEMKAVFLYYSSPKKSNSHPGKKKKRREYIMLIDFNFPDVETKKFLMLVEDLFDTHILIPFYESFHCYCIYWTRPY